LGPGKPIAGDLSNPNAPLQSLAKPGKAAL
jgi:hypothetical protein